MKTILEKLKACKEAIEWVEDKTIEEAVNECPRGDWMLWLAQKLDVDIRLMTLTKGHCANTARHLMIDERSTKAVDVAIAFGKGEATKEELTNANKAAYDAYVVVSADYAASAASATYVAYSASGAASGASYVYYDYAEVRQENQLSAANICREHLGQLIIDKCKSLNN
jgi:hypothetical protein